MNKDGLDIGLVASAISENMFNRRIISSELFNLHICISAGKVMHKQVFLLSLLLFVLPSYATKITVNLVQPFSFDLKIEEAI